MRKKYQYMVVWDKSPEFLNELGAEGWELRGVVNENNCAPKLIFMRELLTAEAFIDVNKG